MDHQRALAEKAARQNEIMREIRKINNKIRETREIIKDLNNSGRTIRREAENWNSAYESCQTDEICSAVYVPDVFEGHTAWRLGEEIPSATALMKGSAGQMESLCGVIAAQTVILEKYITKLQEKIQLLYSQLEMI